ncbi:hypothetical protein ACPPVO_38480 [Dactylosporangium sp. McL0621]
MSGAQRRFLAALVANDDVWTPGLGSIGRTFRELNLPYDQNLGRALANS